MPPTSPSLTFRTPGPWGAFQSSNLNADQIDANFYGLLQFIEAVADEPQVVIDYFVINGDQLYVHMTDHTVHGPYTLPIAAFKFRGEWAPGVAYSVYDVITVNATGSVYLVIWDHTSGGTFNAGASDGIGHPFYGLLITQASVLPDGGTVGQRLAIETAASGFTPRALAWTSDKRVLSVFVEGVMADNELVFAYVVTENMTLPIHLTGSGAFVEHPPTGAQSLALLKNGSSIGSIDFTASPEHVTFTMSSAVTFVAGDLLTITAPSAADPHMSNVAISLVATIG